MSDDLASPTAIFAAAFGILQRLDRTGTRADVINGGGLRTISICANHDTENDLITLEIKANGERVFLANAPRTNPMHQTVTLHKPGRWQQAVIQDWHHGGAPRGAVH